MKKTWPLILAVFNIIILYIISFFIVRNYYSQGLPYYDSVGVYWNIFSIMNTTRNEGLIAGINQAVEYPLSWLHSFFAVIAFPFLPKAPEYIISLNFICLLILIFALNRIAKLFNLTPIQSFLIYLIPLIPASLFWWKGGYFDLRRDASFVTLLAASYFLLSSFLFKPSILLGIICGIIFGLTQWSRGNALPQIIITIAAIYISFFLDKNLRFNWKEVMLKSTSIIFTFIIMSISFYLYNLQHIVLKYSENWSINGERIRSFLDFLPAGPVFFLGYSLPEIVTSLIFFSFIVSSFFYLFKKKVFSFNRNNFQQKYSFFLKSGILLYFLIFSFNVFIVGIKKNLGDYQVYLPFFPLIIGLYSILVFIIASIKTPSYPKRRIIRFIFLISIFVMLLNYIRIEVSIPPIDKNLHILSKKIVHDIGKDLSGKSIAYLWLEDINVHTLNFYLTQSGFKPIKTSSRISKNVDIENPPVSYISIADQQKELAQGLATKEFIVLAKDTSLYQNKDGFFSMFVFGKPVLDELMKDDNFVKRYTFAIRDTPFIVFKNKSLK